MNGPVEAAHNAALGRIDRVESLLLAVPLVDEPNPLERIDAGSRCEWFRYEEVSSAGEADPFEACLLAAQGTEALASEMAGAAS